MKNYSFYSCSFCSAFQQKLALVCPLVCLHALEWWRIKQEVRMDWRPLLSKRRCKQSGIDCYWGVVVGQFPTQTLKDAHMLPFWALLPTLHPSSMTNTSVQFENSYPLFLTTHFNSQKGAMVSIDLFGQFQIDEGCRRECGGKLPHSLVLRAQMQQVH